MTITANDVDNIIRCDHCDGAGVLEPALYAYDFEGV